MVCLRKKHFFPDFRMELFGFFFSYKCCLNLIWGRVSCNSGRNRTPYEAEDDLEVLVLPPPPPRCWDDRHVPTRPTFYTGARDPHSGSYTCTPRIPSIEPSLYHLPTILFYFLEAIHWAKPTFKATNVRRHFRSLCPIYTSKDIAL